MKRPVSIAIALVVFLFVAACEKDHDKAAGGGVDPGDAALFAHIPAGQTVLWGGNYMKLQNALQSLTSSVSALFDQMGSAGQSMSKWMACYAKLSDFPKSRFVGGARVADGAVQLYFAQAGLTVDDVAKCGTDAGLATHVDADHKFVAIDVPQIMSQPALTLGYLLLADGTLYGRESFKMGGMTPAVTGASRAELEADVKAVGGASSASDPMLAKLSGKVDHKKTMWFVGSAASTALAEHLGEIYGTFDMASGMAVDVTAQVIKKEDADKVEQGLTQVKAMADQVPANFKDIIKNLKLDRTGDHLRLQVALSEAQLKSLMSQVGSMIPAAAPGGMPGAMQ